MLTFAANTDLHGHTRPWPVTWQALWTLPYLHPWGTWLLRTGLGRAGGGGVGTTRELMLQAPSHAPWSSWTFL